MHDFKNFPELTNNQMQFYYFESPHRQILENFDAKVVRVIDGDTIRVKWDERDFDFPVRLSLINSAEMEEGGLASKKFLESQILGEEVNIIINPKNRVEKWGRILGEIIHMGQNINQMSMDWGYSVEFGSETWA
jgi:endonuclease YncB( thermonuclease family)